MLDYIETLVGDEGKILIEVKTPAKGTGFATAAGDRGAKTAEMAFGQALETIRLTANSLLGTLNDLAERPDDVRVAFGIKFDREAGAMLTQEVEAQLKVSLAWRTMKETDSEKDES
ncbi:MAG: CU044_2847 family protein [Anaerolineae bacterium]